MEPAAAFAIGKEIVEQVQKFKAYFEPFKPGIRSLSVNYQDGTARLDVSIYAPTRGRMGKKVEIPASESFQVLGMLDDTFNRVDEVWVRTEKGWVLDAKRLPNSSERFLLSMQGRVSTTGLRDFVEVTVPSSPFVEKEEDKYWLHSALRSPDALQAIYQALEINQVNLSVRVAINRCFSTSMPHELKVALEAKSELLKAMASGDRNLEAKAKHRYRSVSKVTKASETDVLKVIAQLISREHFCEFVTATDPYRLGPVSPDEQRITPVPESVAVEALTALTYSQKVAKGELVFAREKYKEDIRNRMKRIL